MYTAEQNQEIEKVIEVFHDYIQNTGNFDVLWSDKLGYLYLNGILEDRDGVCMAPMVLWDGETLCNEIIYHIACDVMETVFLYKFMIVKKRGVMKCQVSHTRPITLPR